MCLDRAVFYLLVSFGYFLDKRKCLYNYEIKIFLLYVEHMFHFPLFSLKKLDMRLNIFSSGPEKKERLDQASWELFVVAEFSIKQTTLVFVVLFVHCALIEAMISLTVDVITELRTL